MVTFASSSAEAASTSAATTAFSTPSSAEAFDTATSLAAGIRRAHAGRAGLRHPAPPDGERCGAGAQDPEFDGS